MLDCWELFGGTVGQDTSADEREHARVRERLSLCACVLERARGCACLRGQRIHGQQCGGVITSLPTPTVAVRAPL